MKIYNEDKTEQLTEFDLNLGQLKEDKIFVCHHEAQQGIEEQGHYETIKEYENGGKDVEFVIDQAGAEPVEAYDEYENIYVYIPYTQQELNTKKIAKIREEMSLRDWEQLRAWRHSLTNSLTEEDTAVIEWFNQKTNEVNQLESGGEEEDD